MTSVDLVETVARTLSTRGLRVSKSVNWWERFIERLAIAERWEYLDKDVDGLNFGVETEMYQMRLFVNESLYRTF